MLRHFPGQTAGHFGRKYFGMMVLALAVSGIGLTVLFLTLAPSVLSLFGAQGTIFALGQEYLLYISFGALFQVLGTGLVPLIRNMAAPSLLWRP